MAPNSENKRRNTRLLFYWSGRRDSNSRRSPWQGDALPLSHSRIFTMVYYMQDHGIWCLRVESNRRHRDFQSLALPTELQRQMATRMRLELTTSSVTGWRSNQLNYRASNIFRTTHCLRQTSSTRKLRFLCVILLATASQILANLLPTTLPCCSLRKPRAWSPICYVVRFRICVANASGGSYRARTCDILLVRQTLSQLS